MKVLVCGGRDYDRKDVVYEFLNRFPFPITQIINGGAPGADQFSSSWAYENKIGFCEYQARWRKYGRSAGPMRNQQMLDEAKPDVVVAFPGGKGTANMVMQAKARGIRVIEYGRS